MILQKIAFSQVFWWLSFGEGVQVHHFIILLISYWKGSLLPWQASSWHAQWGCVWGEKWKMCSFFPLNQPPLTLNKFAFWTAKFWTRCWKVFNVASSDLEPIRDVFYFGIFWCGFWCNCSQRRPAFQARQPGVVQGCRESFPLAEVNEINEE